VSPFGDDTSPGTLAQPFQTITKGIASIGTPGDVLFLRGGSYAENVEVIKKEGTAEAPIRIRAYGRESVSIDGAEPQDVVDGVAHFRVGSNHEWKPATDEDPDAHPDEYLSVRTFPTGDGREVRRGAFMDREPYTRLISYFRLEDLRADNQTFGRLPLDDPLAPLPGLPVVDEHDNIIKVPGPDGTPVPFKRPWVYMGPGLFFDTAGRVHIRLTHTANNVPGIVDYDGGTDPRQLRLAISRDTPAPLVVDKCKFVHFEHVAVRFGGEVTVKVERSEDVVFDHVRVLAAQFGIRLGQGNTRLVFQHCEVLGGIPTWMFRNDVKDLYRAKASDGFIDNNLAHATSEALMFGVESDVDTVIHHCEFVDGHDLGVFGRGTRFHHNWIHNMNDDGLIVDLAETQDLEVSQNVIMRCLEALSFARTKPENIGGSRRVHRNLIDLRLPTTGIRPRPCHHLAVDDEENPDGGVFRFGQLYKGNAPDGPLDLFQNTVLVAQQGGNAGIQHYRDSDPINKTRRSFNNIFVDVTPSTDRREGYASAFLPAPTFHGPTDANCYHQITDEEIPVVRHLGYDLPAHQDAASFLTLADYRGENGPPATSHFEDSQGQYPPGFEKNGVDDDPAFHRIEPDGVPQFDDDLRILAGPAQGQGRVLSDPDVGIDDPLAPNGPPDLGCFQISEHADIGLDVGVDGRRRFPEHP
jgi:hypothetical protein